jgi:hypothetical protein
MGKGNLNLGFCGVPAPSAPPPPPPPPPAPTAKTQGTNACLKVPCGAECPPGRCQSGVVGGGGGGGGDGGGSGDPNLTLYGSYDRTDYDENALNAGRNTPKSNSGAKERYLNQKMIYNQSFINTVNILLGIGIISFSIRKLMP